MSVKVLTDCAAYVQGYDFTSDVNEVRLPMSADVKEKTTFGSGGWREFMNGLRTGAFDMMGFWQSATSGAVDPESFPDLGVADRVYSFLNDDAVPADPVTVADENTAWILKGTKFTYEVGGPVGEIIPFKLGSTAGSAIKRGHAVKPRGNHSATGQLGSTYDTVFGISPTQTIYVAFHVFTAGTTITLQLQHDDNLGFATPTTIATIGPITTVGATWMTPVLGPTDRYLRLNVSAITGTFNVAATIAIS